MFRLFGRNQKNLRKMTQTDKEKLEAIKKLVVDAVFLHRQEDYLENVLKDVLKILEED